MFNFATSQSAVCCVTVPKCPLHYSVFHFESFLACSVSSLWDGCGCKVIPSLNRLIVSRFGLILRKFSPLTFKDVAHLKLGAASRH